MSSHVITSTKIDIKEFFTNIFSFNQLSKNILNNLSSKAQILRYNMGRSLVTREAMPQQISIIYQGQARLLGFDSRIEENITLKLLSPGEVLGWVSHVRGVPCEWTLALL
ncbi:hypothetical protein [Scytonema sp. NUACC26]|uniref:hypothetical protein n=1 Tax=Scytonema sp. NUACC26 TaxID=3140176 RepID=UPI0034DC353F